MSLLARLIISALCFGSATVVAEAQITMSTQIDSVSYTIGMQLGKQIKSDTTIGVKVDLLRAGLDDALRGSGMRISDSDAVRIISDFQAEMMSRQEEMNRKRHDEDSIAGAANELVAKEFLAANRKKKGVITLPSGLQYEVIKMGAGPTPGDNAQVTALYRGMLIDGTLFDSSYSSVPVTFGLNEVIPGWTEGLRKMKVGSKYRLYVPPSLAYGNNPPPGGRIKPGSALVFEIELLDIKRN